MLLQTLGDRTGFKVRAAAVIVRDGRVLMHRQATQEMWYLPGGTGEFGESARDTLVRELREELDVDASVGRLLWMAEHFFETTARRWHQLGWFFETALPAGCDAVLSDTWQQMEEEGAVIFRWIPFAELPSLVHVPGFLAGGLADLPREPRHLVQVDRLP